MELKIGNKVLVYYNRRKSIQTIEKITPKGSVRLSNGSLYNLNGHEKTSDVWGSTTFVLLTKELEEELLKEKVVKSTLDKIKNINILSYEQAVGILEILKAVE